MNLGLITRHAKKLFVLLISMSSCLGQPISQEKSVGVCIEEADQLVKILSELCVLHEGLTLGAEALVKFDKDELNGVFAVEEIVKIVIQTRKILELFCRQFDEFARAVSDRIEVAVIEQFKLLCDKLEKIEIDLKKHDLEMCSKIPLLDQKINRVEDRFIIAIYTMQRAIVLCNNVFKSILSDAQAQQTVSNDNMYMLFLQVQKNISTLCQSLLTDLHLLVNDESNQDITHINEARKILTDGYQDAQGELCQAQLNMLTALNEDTQSILTLLLTQASVFKAKLCSFEKNMSNVIQRNSTSLELMAVLNTNELCKALSIVRTSMALGHNQIETALSDFGSEISRQNIGIASKIEITSKSINKRIIFEFGILEANLVALAQQLVTKIALVHDDIVVLIDQEFGQLGCTLAQYQDSIKNQLDSIQAMVAGGAKQAVQQTCCLLLGGMGELTSKIGTLSADTCLFNTEVANGLEKLDANITGVLCRKMSNFNLAQHTNTRDIANQITAVEGSILTGVTSKLSSFETNLSLQRDSISSKLSTFETTVKNETAKKLNTFACNTAMRQQALCSKVMAVEANLEATTQIQVSSFSTNVSQQLDELCAALIESEINITSDTATAVDDAQSEIDMRYEVLCARIESGQDTLDAGQADLCSQIADLDAFLQSNIEDQATQLCDELESLQFKADAISLALTALSIVVGFLAGRTAPIPPLPV